jgi:hypothetical protein
MVNTIMIACTILGGHSTCNPNILLMNLHTIPHLPIENKEEIKILRPKNKYYDNIKEYFIKKYKLNFYNKHHNNKRF